jgi:hypothetical protein
VKQSIALLHQFHPLVDAPDIIIIKNMNGT